MKTIKNKITTILCSVLLLVSALQTNAQSINLIGVKLENDSLFIMEWNNQSPSVYTSVSTNMYSFTAGTSTYNPNNSNYYVLGVNDSGSGVIQYDANTNIQQEVDLKSFYNGSIETDMSTGMMYYYKGNSMNEVYLYKYNPYLDSNYEIGLLPWSSGFTPGNFVYFPDATCYNSNDHIYYFTIADSSGKYLVAVPVNNSTFTYSITAYTGIPLPGNIGLEYDNVNNVIYTLLPEYDTIAAPPSLKIGLVNPTTASTSLLLSLPHLLGYEVFNRCFDQATNSLVFVAYDDSLYERKLYTYRSDSNILNSFELPSAVYTYEVEVNNTAFSIAKYGDPNAIRNVENNTVFINLYPNPTTDEVTINYMIDENKSNMQIQLFDAQGKEISREIITPSAKTGYYKMNLMNINAGIYYVKILTGNNLDVKKLIIN